MNRAATLNYLKNHPSQTVLIIGAGINGIGTFRDLAMQGVECLLVDKGDFCSGASMASSHMLHGGIRYLENGEFRLVREALHERNNLLRNAPHLTHPLPTTIPIFKWFSGIFNAPMKFLGLLDKPAERGAVIIKLGLMIYDAYVRGDSPMPNHLLESRKKALEKWPILNPEVRFTATYYDGAMYSPERLAVEILLDGVAEGNHAKALNYVTVVGRDGQAVMLRDQITGEEISVNPEIVINAAGPWIDFVNRNIHEETDFIGGTKGSHLIVDHPALRKAIGNHEFFFEYVDGRIVLIFPFLDHVLIGTTDLRIENPDQVTCTEEEIEYILGMVPHVFPGLNLTREDIIFHFTGVRPLPPAEGSTGQVSRDHSIKVIESGDGIPWPILNLVGGKWTSFRAFSEQAADQVLDRLNLPRKGSTANLPVGGGKAYPQDQPATDTWIEQVAASSGFSNQRVRTLFERYGTRAAEISKTLPPQGDIPLTHLPEYSHGEITFLINHEMITRLDDFLLRRSLVGWTGKVHKNLIDELAGVVGTELAWSDEEKQQEIERTLHIFRHDHGVDI